MKLGVTLSTSLHTVLIGFALVSISGPAPLITLEEEGVQVDFAIDSDTESGRGEKQAEVDPQPAPLPSERPETVENAQNSGEANEDSPSREGIANERTLDTEKTTAAPEAEKQVNAPEVKSEPVISPDKTETPVPTTEVASLNEQPEPVREQAETEDGLAAIDPDAQTPTSEAIPTPTFAPANRPRPKTAQTTERKKQDEAKREQTATSTEDRSQVTDRIGQLLNSAETTAGGAKRSQRVASIGNPEAKTAPRLSKGEYDALKGRVNRCWSIPTFVDLENLKVTMLMRMARDGYMADIVSIDVTGVANPAHASAVKSSLQRNLDRRNCDFSDVLPVEKYETWKDVKVNFEPRDF